MRFCVLGFWMRTTFSFLLFVFFPLQFDCSELAKMGASFFFFIRFSVHLCAFDSTLIFEVFLQFAFLAFTEMIFCEMCFCAFFSVSFGRLKLVNGELGFSVVHFFFLSVLNFYNLVILGFFFFFLRRGGGYC